MVQLPSHMCKRVVDFRIRGGGGKPQGQVHFQLLWSRPQSSWPGSGCTDASRAVAVTLRPCGARRDALAKRRVGVTPGIAAADLGKGNAPALPLTVTVSFLVVRHLQETQALAFEPTERYQ